MPVPWTISEIPSMSTEMSAARLRGQVAPLVLSAPVEVEVDLHAPYTVDLATLVTGFARAPRARARSRSPAETWQRRIGAFNCLCSSAR